MSPSNSATAPPAVIHARILADAAVRLWGLTPRERLTRLLHRAGVAQVGDTAEPAPAGGSVILMRGDYVYDDRVVIALVRTPNVLLRVTGDDGPSIVAAHVPAALAPRARDVVSGSASPDLPGVAVKEPESLASASQVQLRKLERPFVRRARPELRCELEDRLFTGAYKGVTDLVTKWLWPVPARWATGLCVRWGLRPNHVTLFGLALVILAGVAFACGERGWGLAAAWLMTFLDTVDGKLARVTVTSSRFGHWLDHGVDLIHPPLWYIAWGSGLETFEPAVPGLLLAWVLWVTVAGYVVGRLVEGAFQLLAPFSIFLWRRIDSYSRLITARRNPNLIWLTAGALLGRPDLGLVAVAAWTALSSVVLLVRLAMAARERYAAGPLRSWLVDATQDPPARSLATRIFATSADR
ncbi:MAG TPA: CDP-alcohol phosphatidyltransferase family protein [Methylomirabilota bacterium]|nr:CDP-alcohol phosphatidyltransferase family protein [Methylomirabilota bacterium]